MSADPLFTQDFGVLVREGNWFRFSFRSPYEKANSLAKLVIYLSIGMSAYHNSCKYVIYGILLVGVIGIFFSLNNPQIPLNMYYKAKLTSLQSAYGAPHRAGARRVAEGEFRKQLLNNVRERIIYQGEDIEIPYGSDYMQGGTRPLAPNNTDALRNNRFFQNVHNQVFYEPAIPYRYF